MKFFDEKDKRILELENENSRLLKEIKQLKNNIDALTQVILHAEKQRFGSSREKTPYAEQTSFFNDRDYIGNGFSNILDFVTIKEHKRPVPKRKKGDRTKLIEELPKEIVKCVLNPEKAKCGVCKNEMKVIGCLGNVSKI